MYEFHFSIHTSPSVKLCSTVLDITLSNSSIIHEEKTQGITTIEEVWKCDPNNIVIKFGELLLWISPRIINVLRSYIKYLNECFIRYQNTSRLVKRNLPCTLFFNPLVIVWVPDKRLFLTFDILLHWINHYPVDKCYQT